MAIDETSLWREVGDIPYSIWWDTILKAGGPVQLASESAYQAAKPHTALALAMLKQESSYATDFDQNPGSNRNPFNLKNPLTDDPNDYMEYKTWAEGVKGWADRITSPTYPFGHGVYAKTNTVKDLIYVFAPPYDQVHTTTDAYIKTITALMNGWKGATPVPDIPAKTKPAILVIAGHRNTSGGDPAEAARTDDMARAYQSAFTSAGYRCTYLQRELDSDALPDDTAAGLDTVSRLAGKWMSQQEGFCIVFDDHFEGAGAKGVFGIAPNGTGLTTGASVPQAASDTWDNNTLDRQLATLITKKVAAATGLTIRGGLRSPGVMDERATGVGLQGYRLATFAYTSPYYLKGIRLVIEHGDIVADRAIIDSPGFFAKCAGAVVAAVTEMFGVVNDPAPEPTPEPIPAPEYATPELPQKGTHIKNGSLFLAPGSKRVIVPTTPRQYAGKTSKATGPDLPVGTKIDTSDITHYVIGDGELWLIVKEVPGVKDGSRILAKHLTITTP